MSLLNRLKNAFGGFTSSGPPSARDVVGRAYALNAAIAHLRANNVKFKLEPFPTPVCRMAFILDPDGNTICIHKRNAG